ncbi:unnamed protein product [Lactuca saligna]|uniref:Uncharacterized protein n=1 Tax=Lactuca saligna TaxID=75948 RepID=A0AA35ZJN9_LACSI|nr:unnamed protein product [Lactuca saligna]
MRSLDVDYVLVVFGGVTGYSSDDINKKGTRWSPIAFNKTKNKHIPKPSTHSRSSPKERSGNFQSSSVTKFKQILLDMNRMLSFLCNKFLFVPVLPLDLHLLFCSCRRFMISGLKGFSKIEGLELLMGVIYLVPMHLQNLMEVVMWHWFIEPILGLAKWMEPKSIKDKDERKRKQKFSGYWEQMQEMPKLFIGEVGHTKVEGNLKFLLTREKKNEHSANGGRRAMYLQTCRTSFFHVHSY